MDRIFNFAPMNESTGYVISKDGTSIGYRQFGHGQGIILVHGAMMTSQNFMELGRILSKDFTVYIPDRQGRGLSGTRVKHSLIGESEDIQALVEKTNTENIFGLSSGATIALQAAIYTPSLKRIALYEPPIPIGDSIPLEWYADYEIAISKGHLGKAFILIMKGIGDKSLFSVLPRFMTAPLMDFLIKRQKGELKDDEIPLKQLVPTFQYDYKIVRESAELLNTCKDLKSKILLLGGSKSQGFLKLTLNQLRVVLPEATKIELSGLGHLAADNSGKPEIVAEKLKQFFLH